jgi:hypothetical protein
MEPERGEEHGVDMKRLCFHEEDSGLVPPLTLK